VGTEDKHYNLDYHVVHRKDNFITLIPGANVVKLLFLITTATCE
jgi:hypothetical protein